MINIHDLDGCAPAPLAHYLKALGILRLVAEQVDPQARGWWEGDRFRLATTLSREELEAFFLKKYEPTAMASPWNRGSGFFGDNVPFLASIEKSNAPRFRMLRTGISESRVLLDKLAEADKNVREIKDQAKDKRLTKADKQALKADLIPNIRLVWRGSHREWMDAAMVLGDNGKPQFPALLGTGGNDGRLDFTNNYFQRINDIFDLSDAEGKPLPISNNWLYGSLWGFATIGCQTGSAVGQYLPGAAGGANGTNSPTGDSLLNPIDYLLMLEGAILFTAHVTRRMGATESNRAAAPFAVGAQGSGYASSAAADESARGEQWMPLWSQPMQLAELKHLLGEGRAQLGAKAVKEPLDLARAIEQLGATRGIVAFQRYGYIERNGQANLAVPLGRFRVPEKIIPQLACLDDLDAWLLRLRRAVRDKNASSRLRLVERQLSNALFAVVQHPNESGRWQSILLALSEVEAVILTSKEAKCGFIPRLRPDWVTAADDGSPELRLAVVFALQWDEKPFGAIRRHWIPGKNGETATVMKGRNGIDDAIALVKRRLIEASQNGQRRLTLKPQIVASAHLTDLALLLADKVDIDRTIALARALTALDVRRWKTNPRPPQKAQGKDYPDDAWLAIRLAMLPWPLPDGRNIGVDPAILRRLESGDAATAVDLALRRLRAAGIAATVRCAVVAKETARLWAAALAFPITPNLTEKFVHRLDPNIN